MTEKLTSKLPPALSSNKPWTKSNKAFRFVCV